MLLQSHRACCVCWHSCYTSDLTKRTRIALAFDCCVCGWAPPKSLQLATACLAFYGIVAIVALPWHHFRSWMLDDAVHAAHKHDYFMSSYEALTALCLIPQLCMFHQKKRVTLALGNFVMLFASQKIFSLCFWTMVPWVYDVQFANCRIAVILDVLCLVILSDFLYCWASSRYHGHSEVILSDLPKLELAVLPRYTKLEERAAEQQPLLEP